MKFDPPGRFRDVAAFRARLRELDAGFDADADLLAADGPLGQPYALCGHRLGNRFAVHPMEGWDGSAEGRPSALTRRRWRRFGASGADLIWGGEAFAVQRDGRANPHQLYLHGPEARADLEELLTALRAGRCDGAGGGGGDGLFVGLQLTHSGRFARPEGAPAPRPAAPHPVLDAQAPATPLTDAELEGIGSAYVEAARTAAAAGFDFVDLKCCHGYLLHELLGARARPGPYGGSFENRTRFFRNLVGAVRAACPGLEIGVRLSVGDALPHAIDPATGVGAPLGWRPGERWEHGFGIDAADPENFDFTEPFRFLELLRELRIGLVNVTLGSPYYCPHLQRPAAYPPSDGYPPPRDPLLEVARHLQATSAVKAAFPDLCVVGTGYSYLQEWLPHVAQHELRSGHVDFVGLGRMVLSYPELPRDVLAGRPLERRAICRTFSDCTTAPRNGLPSGCYPLDAAYRELEQAAALRAIKRAATRL
ncbi:MAG TPA: NADH:flavin oxidoreductase [Planctomycetota bacterium]